MTSSPGSAAVFVQSGIDVESCRKYILGRQTPQGGFSFYRYGPWGVEEPNTQDTRAALNGLHWLGEPVPHRDAVISWLLEQQASDGGYSSHMIADGALSALQCLQTEPLHDPTRYLMAWAGQLHIADNVAMDASMWLDSARRCARLLIAYGVSVAGLRETVQSILPSQNDESGGYVSGAPNVISTWNALALASTLDLECASGKALEFTRQCENPQWGFTLTPASSASELSVHFAGMHTLKQFGLLPRYPQALEAFVVMCQAGTGGFGRVPAAVPGLRETACALNILLLLAEGREDGLRT